MDLEQMEVEEEETKLEALQTSPYPFPAFLHPHQAVAGTQVDLSAIPSSSNSSTPFQLLHNHPTHHHLLQHHQQQNLLLLAEQEERDSTLLWDSWLAYLATHLSPEEWESYWALYLNSYGLGSLPPHLLPFFAPALFRDHSPYGWCLLATKFPDTPYPRGRVILLKREGGLGWPLFAQLDRGGPS